MEEKYRTEKQNYKCLELGGGNGGLALWLSIQGNEVIGSDLESPEKYASEIHTKHKASVQYQSIDAINIPYENHFDIISFKSILGGISRNKNNVLKEKVIHSIYNALKVNGVLLFAENLDGSTLHQLLRRKFVKWGNEWNYLRVEEIEHLFSPFKNVKYITVGFFGAFGRNELQRNILGRLDSWIEPFVPKNKRYILIGIAEK